MASTTAEAEIRKLFRSDEKKSCRCTSATKLSKVGWKVHLTGTASRSSLVLKAARMIQRMGRKKTIDDQPEHHVVDGPAPVALHQAALLSSRLMLRMKR